LPDFKFLHPIAENILNQCLSFSQGHLFLWRFLFGKTVPGLHPKRPVIVGMMFEVFDVAFVFRDKVLFEQLFRTVAADWKFQFTTPNASTHYVYFNFNLKDGPVVLDIPPTVGAGLFGSLCDAWQTPLADVGANGDDKGKGGKYLLLSPNYKQIAPAGYFPIQFQTVKASRSK
jgi:hypothetical protein